MVHTIVEDAPKFDGGVYSEERKKFWRLSGRHKLVVPHLGAKCSFYVSAFSIPFWFFQYDEKAEEEQEKFIESLVSSGRRVVLIERVNQTSKKHNPSGLWE